MTTGDPVQGSPSIAEQYESILRPLRLILSVAVGGLAVFSTVVEESIVGSDVVAFVMVLAVANVAWNLAPRTGRRTFAAAGIQAVLDAVLALLAVAIVDGNSSPLAWLLLILPVLGVAAHHGMVGAFFTWLAVSVAYSMLLINVPSTELTRAESVRLGLEQSIAVIAIAVPMVMLGARIRHTLDGTRAALDRAEQTRRQLRLTSRAAQRMGAATTPDEVLDIALETVLALGYDRADVAESIGGRWQLLAASGSGGSLPTSAFGLLDRASQAVVPGKQTPVETGPVDRQALHEFGFGHAVALVVGDDALELGIRAFVDERTAARPGGTEALETLSQQVFGSLANTLTTVRLTDWASELHHRANHDELTGLPNRANLLAALGDVAEPNVAVLFLDLNGFKEVNDEHGHEAGDTVLRVVAKRLQSLVGDDEFVARLGGDEFVMFTKARSQADLSTLAERTAAVVTDPIVFSNISLRVGTSIGIAEAGLGDTATELLHGADLAMYEAKIIAHRTGRSQHRFRAEAANPLALRGEGAG